MKDNTPWSVEGVDRPARQAAAAAAAEAGVSLGTWLSHMVRQGTGPGKPAMAGGEALADAVAPRKGAAKETAAKPRSGRVAGILAILTLFLLAATGFLWRQILFPVESEPVVATVAEVTAAAEAEPVAPVAVTAAPDLSPGHPNRELAWIRESAERGVAGAQERLGRAYLAGREGVARDYAQAHRWLELAAAQRSAEALFQLGVMHEKGLGVVPSDEAAAQWYEQATALDHPPALHNLAVMQAQGRGVAQDYLVAAELFSRAAERNLAISQYNLGVLHETGRGVEKNLVEAYRWYSLAAKQGNRNAVERRDAVAEKLSSGELAEAQQLAADWRPLASGAAAARPLPPSSPAADRNAVIVE